MVFMPWAKNANSLFIFNSYSASHDNWCTGTLWNRVITAQCEGMGEVGSARYEPALLPPCSSIRAYCYKLLVLYKFYSAISASVFSSQKVQYNRMQAMTQIKLIMLCTDKGSMVQTQYCSEWTELVMVWHDYSIPCSNMTYAGRRNLNCVWLLKDLAQGDKDQSCENLLSSSSIYYWFASSDCKSDTRGADFRYLLL